MNSAKYSLNWADFAKGLLMVVIGAVVTALSDVLSTSPIVFDWKKIGLIGLTAGVSYLVKNFFSGQVAAK